MGVCRFFAGLERLGWGEHRPGRYRSGVVWLGERRGHAIDWFTQRWVQLTGQRVSLAGEPWLDGPTGSTDGIGADFFQRWGDLNGLTLVATTSNDGLIGGLAELTGSHFEPELVSPAIDDFYAHTSGFDLAIESRWSAPFHLVGWLISRLFARRLAQLNMPLSDSDLRGGVDSRIVKLADSNGEPRHTGWVRTMSGSGLPVFVGQYGTDTIPGHAGPVVKVVFPLPNGNAIVFLRPVVESGGGMSLVSDGRRFGDPGFYFTVTEDPGTVWARYVRTMKERLSLEVRGDTIHAQHRFRVFGLPFLELRYRIHRQV